LKEKLCHPKRRRKERTKKKKDKKRRGEEKPKDEAKGDAAEGGKKGKKKGRRKEKSRARQRRENVLRELDGRVRRGMEPNGKNGICVRIAGRGRTPQAIGSYRGGIRDSGHAGRSRGTEIHR